MTYKEYTALTLTVAKTLRFRTLAPVRTNALEIPAGVVVRVVGKINGFTIATEKCKCCGVSAYARRVPAAYLEVIR